MIGICWHFGAGLSLALK